MFIDALFIPPQECRGKQKRPTECECLRTLATGMISNILDGIGTITVENGVSRFPIERGVLSPTYSVRVERPDIGSLRELNPILAHFLEETLGAGKYELRYGVVPMGRVTRESAGNSRLDPNQLGGGPGKPAGIEKLTGWFPCIPALEKGVYTTAVVEQLMHNRLGVGAHFILMEPEPGAIEN
jgi:hypothetical protein